MDSAKKFNRKGRTYYPPPAKKVVVPAVPVQKTCTTCKATFTTSYKWIVHCDACSRMNYFRSNIGNILSGGSAYRFSNDEFMPPVEKFRTDFEIRLEFEIVSNSHDGYCSDHESSDIRTNRHTKTITAKLFRDITDKDFDAYTNIVTNTVLLNKLYCPDNNCNCNCSHGSNLFTILSGTIFKIADRIKLGD